MYGWIERIGAAGGLFGRAGRAARSPLAVACLVGLANGAHPKSLGAQQSGDAFVRWARAHAIALRTLEGGGDDDELRPLAALIGDARVVALGEAAHGAHEPLAFRNRLFRWLVEKQGFTAIALETGFAESRRIQGYIAGGPGDADSIAGENLSWGFGAFRENAELIRWMREYDADPSHRQKIRFYGIDLSLGGRAASTPTAAPFEEALSYLDRVDPAAAGRERAALEPYLRRLPDPATSSFSPAEHAAFSAAIDSLIAVLERERPAPDEATYSAEWEWAQHDAIVAKQANRVFRVLPADAPGGAIPPEAWRPVEARDSAMATNVRWIMRQEGPNGRVLVFAHDAHVKNAPTEGGVWSAFSRPPRSMGQFLRAGLGDRLVIVGTASAGNGAGLPPPSPDSAGADAALARVGPPLFALDLRPARRDDAVAGWLAAKRSLRANFTTELSVPLGTAFDVIVFLGTLTPARTSVSAR